MERLGLVKITGWLHLRAGRAWTWCVGRFACRHCRAPSWRGHCRWQPAAVRFRHQQVAGEHRPRCPGPRTSSIQASATATVSHRGRSIGGKRAAASVPACTRSHPARRRRKSGHDASLVCGGQRLRAPVGPCPLLGFASSWRASCIATYLVGRPMQKRRSI